RSLVRHGSGVAVLPWETDPNVLPVPRRTPTTVPLAAGSLLLTGVAATETTGWLLWLEDPQRTAWDETAVADLTLVGLTLVRRLVGEPTPRWSAQLERAARQQALEQVAVVVRRLAHDFGNVLTGILGFCELSLAQPMPASSHLHAYLTEVLH